jgi:hypothetical protein
MRTQMRALLLATALAGASLLTPRLVTAESTEVAGTVSWISEDAVEVGGKRGLFAPGSDVRSGGVPVAKSSVRPGMPAEMEVDDGGRVLELRVMGVVE